MCRRSCCAPARWAPDHGRGVRRSVGPAQRAGARPRGERSTTVTSSRPASHSRRTASSYITCVCTSITSPARASRVIPVRRADHGRSGRIKVVGRGAPPSPGSHRSVRSIVGCIVPRTPLVGSGCQPHDEHRNWKWSALRVSILAAAPYGLCPRRRHSPCRTLPLRPSFGSRWYTHGIALADIRTYVST